MESGSSPISKWPLTTEVRLQTVNALPHDPTVVQTYRDTYANGISSYLDNLYRNFVFARILLSDTGSIFVQIGSENADRPWPCYLMRCSVQSNRVAQITFKRSTSATSAARRACGSR